MSHPPVGIDLGTTNCVVAVMREHGPEVVRVAGQALTPSAVARDERDQWVVGAPALAVLEAQPTRGARRFKTVMGEAHPFLLLGRRYSPTDLSATLLRGVVERANDALGWPIQEAVITVPAWFREPQRQATLQAGKRAGIEVLGLVNEPTAAALANGLHEAEREHHAVVFDLGGGTFDLTVLEYFAGMVEVKSSSGDTRLGGEDVTDAIMEGCLARLGIEPDGLSATVRADVRSKCERTKRALSEVGELEMILHLGETSRSVTVGRSDVVNWCGPLIRRMRASVRDALSQGAVPIEDVDEVLLVGGATRMPLVRDLAAELFGRAPSTRLDPDQVVGIGAAVHAGMLRRHEAVKDLVLTDVLTHSLGTGIVRTYGNVDMRDRFDPILHRGTTLPASRVAQYFTMHPKQSHVTLHIYEGEHRETKFNDHLGTIELTDIPTHEDEHAREALDVRFTHDANGLLEVEARLVSTGERVHTVLQRTGAELDEASLEVAVKDLQRLKQDPATLLPNRVALDRANEVLMQLPADERDFLDQAIGQFEASLVGEDAGRRDRLRQRLNELVRQFAERHGI